MFEYEIDPYYGCEHQCRYCYTLNHATGVITTFRDIDRLDSELEGLTPQTIYLGMNTDPYQPCERKARVTRRILEILVSHNFSASILTKSDLIVRDIDILRKMAEPSAGVSLSFSDERIRVWFEQNVPDNSRRLEALKLLKEAGISTYILISPVIPYLTDVMALIEKAGDAADEIWIYRLEIRSTEDQNWQNIIEIIKNHCPEIEAGFQAAALDPHHPYWQRLRAELKELKGVEGKLHIEF